MRPDINDVRQCDEAAAWSESVKFLFQLLFVIALVTAFWKMSFFRFNT